MPTLDALTFDGKFRALIFGYYKQGKTAGALTMPRPNFLDFDNGIVVGLSPWHRERFKIDPTTVQFEQFGKEKITDRGVPTTYNIYDSACRYFDESMKPGKVDTFDTWVIDSATTLGEASFNKGMILLQGDNKLTKKALSFTFSQAQATGLIHKKKQDYGAERSLLEQFIDMIIYSGKHVVVLAHAKDEYEGDGDDAKVVGVVPMLTGQSVQKVPLKFNEVYWCELEKDGPKTEAKLFTSADSKIKRGSRWGLPNGTPWNWPAVRKELNTNGFHFSQDGTTPSTTAA